MGDDAGLQKSVFNHYVKRGRFGDLFADKWLMPRSQADLENDLDLQREVARRKAVPLHDLIGMLAKRVREYDRSKTSYHRERQAASKVLHFDKKMPQITCHF